MLKRVVALSFCGEPLARMLIAEDNGLSYIANPARIGAVESGDSDPVGFPNEDIYEYDDESFREAAAFWLATGVAPRAILRPYVNGS